MLVSMSYLSVYKSFVADKVNIYSRGDVSDRAFLIESQCCCLQIKDCMKTVLSRLMILDEFNLPNNHGFALHMFLAHRQTELERGMEKLAAVDCPECSLAALFVGPQTFFFQPLS